jgi:hypothetical protein
MAARFHKILSLARFELTAHCQGVPQDQKRCLVLLRQGRYPDCVRPQTQSKHVRSVLEIGTTEWEL